VGVAGQAQCAMADGCTGDVGRPGSLTCGWSRPGGGRWAVAVVLRAKECLANGQPCGASKDGEERNAGSGVVLGAHPLRWLRRRRRGCGRGLSCAESVAAAESKRRMMAEQEWGARTPRGSGREAPGYLPAERWRGQRQRRHSAAQRRSNSRYGD
jgi:hypothetical protein